MRTRTIVLTVVFVGLTVSARTQEGHPLTGTWAGDWGPSGASRTHITMVMNWDGKAVTGVINPHPDAVSLTGVSVDWGTWTFHMDAHGMAAERWRADIGCAHGGIVGTWSQEGA